MKKIAGQILSLAIAVMMICGMLPTEASAASWNPDDRIQIKVRVYDQSTGATYDVGTDSVRKGDQYIQSDPYTIPDLTKFTSNSYGRVTKVVGNWYFPGGDSNVGATVYWSCNVSSVTMTYWVTSWDTGSGGGSTGSDTIVIGSGNYSMKCTICYHSNYPNGTDYKQTYNYTIYAGYRISTRNIDIMSPAAVGFSAPAGFKLAATPWNKSADGSGAKVNTTYNASNGETVDIYAQWVPENPVTPVTVTYMDGSSTYAVMTYYPSDEVTVVDCTSTKEGYTFKGWATDSSASTVVYAAGDTFTINGNTTLYAVWEKNVIEHTYVLTYDLNGGEGGPTEKQITRTTSEEKVTFTIASEAPTRTGFVFEGWSVSRDGEAQYYGGDELTLTADASSVTLYAVWRKAVSASFIGAAIRVPESYYMDKTYEENLAGGGLEKTNLRFGFMITLPENMSMEDLTWSWEWNVAGSSKKEVVEGKNYTCIDEATNTYRTNLVITDIPLNSDYGTVINAVMTVSYMDQNGNTVKIEQEAAPRSVQFVTEAIKRTMDSESCKEIPLIQSYVADLYRKMNSGN